MFTLTDKNILEKIPHLDQNTSKPLQTESLHLFQTDPGQYKTGLPTNREHLYCLITHSQCMEQLTDRQNMLAMLCVTYYESDHIDSQ